MRPCLLVAVLCVLPAQGRAQDGADGAPAADSSRDEEARALFEAGRTAFEAGRFSDALAHFERSYDLSARHVLLFSIGICHDRLRQDAQALEAFEAYLELVPDASNAAEVTGRIDVLRRAIAERRAAEPPDGATDPPTEPAPAVASPPPAGEFRPIGSSILAGLALVAGGLTVGFWVDANDRYAALERGCFALRGGCTDEEISGSGIETGVTVTNALLVTSLVLGAAAVVVLILEIPTGSQEHVDTVALRVGPASIAIAGEF